MPPVRTIKNQYQGINAHLHSYWQNQGGWEEFHTSHIVYLSAALRMQLLPMGYTAGIEQSLQIRRYDEPAGKPKSDVTIYDTDPRRSRQPVTSENVSAPLITPIAEMIDDLEEVTLYRAIAIYKIDAKRGGKGKPVAWIELLSPSNKAGGQDDFYYLMKRQKLLHTGLVFVEIDYLHQSAPTFSKMPNYTLQDEHHTAPPGSHPYRIVVVDPHPSYYEGQTYTYPFVVDEKVPSVSIPLSGKDTLRFDFDQPYNKTIEESLFAWELVDYSQLPLNFDRYSRDDQLRILARMMAVLKGARDGVDLETGTPLPIEDLPYEQALSQLTSWQ